MEDSLRLDEEESGVAASAEVSLSGFTDSHSVMTVQSRLDQDESSSKPLGKSEGV